MAVLFSPRAVQAWALSSALVQRGVMLLAINLFHRIDSLHALEYTTNRASDVRSRKGQGTRNEKS